MNRKLLSIFLIFSVTAVAVFSASSLSAESEISEPLNDVHGISYRNSNSFSAGVLPSTTNVYPTVIWYVYSNDGFTVKTDGIVSYSTDSSGLITIKDTYAVNSSHTVSFLFSDGTQQDFKFTVRNTIYIYDDSLKYAEPVEMTNGEYNLTIIFSFVLGVVCFVVPMYISYRIFRRRARKGERVL